MDRDALERISLTIIQAAIKIHRHLAPALLENVYRACMIYELRERGVAVTAEQIIPIRYKTLVMDGVYRIDLVVKDAVIVELKSVETILPVHSAQLLSYLRLTERRVGLLINFNVEYLVKGVRPVVNKF